MTETEGFHAAITRQTELMLKMARQAEQRGYFLVLTGLNDTATKNKYLFSYLQGGFTEFFKRWCEANGRKYVRIAVHVVLYPGNPRIDAGTLTWRFKLPRTKRFRPIIAALETMGRRRTSRRDPTGYGSGPLMITELPGYFEISGRDRSSLELAVAMLDMPHHRAILLDRYRIKE
jgi:hypothetical protein